MVSASVANKIDRLESQVSALNLNPWQLEREVNNLLKALNTEPASERDYLKERLFTITATALLTASIMKGFDSSPMAKFFTLEKSGQKTEQVQPSLGRGSAPALAQVDSTTAKPLAKPTTKPPTKPTAEFRARLAQTLANPIEPEAKPAAKPVAKPEGDFAAKVRQVAKNIGADPIDLLTLMSFESAGTLSPSQRGPEVPGQGSAVGLIQFMPATAEELGTSTEELASMSAIDQLDYVEKYLVKRGFKGGSLKELYSTVFAGHPNAPGSISDGYHTLDSAVARMNAEHRGKAIALLNGGGSKFADTKAIIASWKEQFQKDPVTGDVIAGYAVTSPRGMRTHPVTGQQKMHQGVDLGTPSGTPIYAIADGVIECESWPDAGGAGLFTSNKFPGLRFDLLHLDKCIAEPGTKRQVKEGEVIAHTGSWGTGPHLHLAIKSQDSGNFLRVRTGWLHWFVTGKAP